MQCTRRGCSSPGANCGRRHTHRGNWSGRRGFRTCPRHRKCTTNSPHAGTGRVHMRVPHRTMRWRRGRCLLRRWCMNISRYHQRSLDWADSCSNVDRYVGIGRFPRGKNRTGTSQSQRANVSHTNNTDNTMGLGFGRGCSCSGQGHTGGTCAARLGSPTQPHTSRVGTPRAADTPDPNP
jgi:hypothetical protein